MLLVVTGVGFLIHIYSVGYMWDDDGYYRFMSYLNLFMFFMLTLVLAKNYLMMFIGWEGVGLASYLLIGFWFTKDSAAVRGQEGVYRQPHRRLRIPDCALPDDQAFRHARLPDAISRRSAPLAKETSGIGLLTAIGLLLMVGRGRASRRRFLFMSGCPMPWKARRRSPR